MLTTLLLATTLAQAAAPEVGTTKRFGIGFEAGSPVTFTGKYWFDDQGGLAFHVGTWFGYYLEGRVQYERQFVQFGDWDFADLGMYWHAGAIVRTWTLAGYDGDVGVGPEGGVGAEMRFKDVPAAVFVEVGSSFYVIGNDYTWFGYSSGAGGRWYF